MDGAAAKELVRRLRLAGVRGAPVTLAGFREMESAAVAARSAAGGDSDEADFEARVDDDARVERSGKSAEPAPGPDDQGQAEEDDLAFYRAVAKRQALAKARTEKNKKRPLGRVVDQGGAGNSRASPCGRLDALLSPQESRQRQEPQPGHDMFGTTEELQSPGSPAFGEAGFSPAPNDPTAATAAASALATARAAATKPGGPRLSYSSSLLVRARKKGHSRPAFAL